MYLLTFSELPFLEKLTYRVSQCHLWDFENVGGGTLLSAMQTDKATKPHAVNIRVTQHLLPCFCDVRVLYLQFSLLPIPEAAWSNGKLNQIKEIKNQRVSKAKSKSHGKMYCTPALLSWGLGSIRTRKHKQMHTIVYKIINHPYSWNLITCFEDKSPSSRTCKTGTSNLHIK
jgi:hypothetical protein